MRFLKTHLQPLQVQFEDIDAAGYVHHPNYLLFIERARYQSLRELDFGFERQLRNGQTFVIAEMQQRYLRPLEMGQEVFVLTRLVAIRRSSMRVHQSITLQKPTESELSAAGDDIFSLPGTVFNAQLRLVYLDLQRKQVIEVPQQLRTLLEIPDEGFFETHPECRDVRFLGWDQKNPAS